MKILFVCSLALLLSSQLQADPTKPASGWQIDGSAVQSAAAPVSLRLQLIKNTEQGLVALINGQLVRKGDRVEQYRVADIQQAQVVLQLNGEQRVLPLLNTAIKQYEE
ncbi:hypothetical protein [Rheinheimera sp.]|uniref:hypothetical protein n=1 Tax=Rheinheimera sp. TaxID=1869214 RepID=UPI0027327CF0|nr:hypothetical protein [Rheinheimera sp.]MDP2716759.1 hypothetical protein [Rheinheimera sp.]